VGPAGARDVHGFSVALQGHSGIEHRHAEGCPADGKPVAYTANGRTYNITEMSVYRTDTNFDLSVRYSVPSTADFNATQADARGLATALATQYPELKEAFNNVWVHAMDSGGGDVVGLINLKPAPPKP